MNKLITQSVRLIARPATPAFIVIFLSQATNAYAGGEENYLNLAERLVVLRGQVSDLSTELQQLRDKHNLEMRGLLTQKNSVGSQINQEEVEIDRLQNSLLENKTLIRDLGADKDSIKQVLLQEAEKLKTYVTTGLPFKAKDRVKSIDDYIASLHADVLSSHKATNSLWSMIEDELKLSRNNGLYRQAVEMNDKDHLAHVAKIGMVMMYFRIESEEADDQYGMYKKVGDKWLAKTVTGNDASQVKSLFTSLEKRIHVGYFELPNAF